MRIPQKKKKPQRLENGAEEVQKVKGLESFKRDPSPMLNSTEVAPRELEGGGLNCTE